MPIFYTLILYYFLTFVSLLLSSKFITYLGFFPYSEYIPWFNLPAILTPFANFDGIHYLLIAARGYLQYEQAFFPLYPLAIKLLSNLLNPFSSALLISNLCFLLSIFIFYRLLLLNQIKNPSWVTAFFALFPTSFFFSAVYTESFFLFLFLSCLYFFQTKRYLLALLFAIFASLARLIGIFLIIPMLFIYLSTPVSCRRFSKLLVCFAPLIGLLIYSLYLYQTTGDPLFFFHAQPAFGANRSVSLILFPRVVYRYLKIFLYSALDFKYLVSVLEFIVFSSFFVILSVQFFQLIKSWRSNHFLLGLNLFSLANLILPTLTGTFSSLPRYALLSLSVFIYLAQLKNPRHKALLLIFFSAFRLIVFAYFIQGYFIA